MAHYAGLDVGLRTTAVCIVDAGGAVRLERSIPSEVDDIAECLAGFGVAIEAVALEAGTLTQWLAQGLRAAVAGHLGRALDYTRLFTAEPQQGAPV